MSLTEPFAFILGRYLKGHKFHVLIRMQKSEILTRIYWHTQYNSKRNQGGVRNSDSKI